MKTEKWYDVRCDFCGFYLSTDFGKGMQRTQKEAETAAKTMGFRTKNNKNICPICLKEKKYEKV